MKNITILSLLSCLLLTGPNFLQGQSTPQEIMQQFFQDLESQGTSVALDKLYATNPWMQNAFEAINSLKEQMAGLTEDFVGKCHGYDLIAEKKATDSFILYSYLARYDRQPIRYTFQFYKPADTWRIYSFKYDSSLDTELEEAAKIESITSGNMGYLNPMIPSNQYEPYSDRLEGVSDGVGGNVGGNLRGRGIVSNPKINGSGERGTVVVYLCVGSSGQVSEARVQLRGTTAGAAAQQQALSNARTWRFSSGQLDKQCGTITYKFI